MKLTLGDRVRINSEKLIVPDVKSSLTKINTTGTIVHDFGDGSFEVESINGDRLLISQEEMQPEN